MTLFSKTLAFGLTGLLSVALVEGVRAQSLSDYTDSVLQGECINSIGQFRNDYRELMNDVRREGGDLLNHHRNYLRQVHNSLTSQERMALRGNILLHQAENGQLPEGEVAPSEAELRAIRARVAPVVEQINERIQNSKGHTLFRPRCYFNGAPGIFMFPETIKNTVDSNNVGVDHRIFPESDFYHCEYQIHNMSLGPSQLSDIRVNFTNNGHATLTVCSYRREMHANGWINFSINQETEVRLCSDINLEEPIFRMLPLANERYMEGANTSEEAHNLEDALMHPLALEQWGQQSGCGQIPWYALGEDEYIRRHMVENGLASLCRAYLPAAQDVKFDEVEACREESRTAREARRDSEPAAASATEQQPAQPQLDVRIISVGEGVQSVTDPAEREAAARRMEEIRQNGGGASAAQ